ncbi:MAG: amidohydrolase family protein, partial [Treponema sp.]|nr:amidohydrolase family protein [Treponema sp.]
MPVEKTGLLIRGALVVSPEDEAVRDVLVEGETIRRVGPAAAAFPGSGLNEDHWDCIDGTGKILIPGGIDAHTHLCLDTGSAGVSVDFYTGTVAAVWGGTTSIIDHPGFGPAGCSLDHQIQKYHRLAEGKAVIDYGFHAVVQHVDDRILTGLDALADGGVTSCKLYLTYGYKIADGDALRVLEKAKAAGVLVTVHPENDGVINTLRERFIAAGTLSPHFHPLSRPPECEAEAINRMILFAHIAGDAPLYIVHLTNTLGLEFIKAARERGQQNLYAETCPQYLLLNDSCYDLGGDEGLKYIICPP